MSACDVLDCLFGRLLTDAAVVTVSVIAPMFCSSALMMVSVLTAILRHVTFLILHFDHSSSEVAHLSHALLALLVKLVKTYFLSTFGATRSRMFAE